MLIKQNQIVVNGTTIEQGDLQAIANVTSDVQAQLDAKASTTTVNAALDTKATIYKSTSAPSSPSAGDLWYNITDTVMFHWSGAEWIRISNTVLDGSTAALAPEYGSDIISALGGAFTPGRYWITGKTSSGHPAQQVYVEADGFMLFYRHAGTGGSYNSTYEIVGDSLGESAVGTLYSPSQGLTDTGSSTTAGSRGMARLATDFVRALGGETDQNIIKMNCGGQIAYITDTQWWATASAGDGYAYDNTISYGSSAANPRSQRTNYTPDPGRPLGTYPGGSPNVIPYYHGNTYSGGYNGTWHVDTTIWVRQY